MMRERAEKYNFQMSGDHQILVSPPAGRRLLALAALAGTCLLAACGQKGPLFLPTGEAAAGRRTLPQTLAPTAIAPARAASAPAGTSVPTTPASTPTPVVPTESRFPTPGTASPTRQP